MNVLLKNQKIRILLALFSLFLLFDMIQGSYAKYVSSAEAGSNITIAKWDFRVNNQDVLNNNNFSETITPVFDGSSYIAPGVIAPGSEGYFDVLIDSSNTDVSFSETISLSYDKNSTIDDLKIIGYKLNDSEFVSFTDETKIVTSHDYGDTNKIDKYRVYVKWIDGEGESMDNYKDTEASKNGVAKIAITIDFLQKAN